MICQALGLETQKVLMGLHTASYVSSSSTGSYASAKLSTLDSSGTQPTPAPVDGQQIWVTEATESYSGSRVIYLGLANVGQQTADDGTCL